MCLSSFDDYECGGYADDSLDVWDGSEPDDFDNTDDWDDEQMYRCMEHERFENKPGFGKYAPAYKHELDNVEMQQLRENGSSYRQIAKRHGCSPSTVRNRIRKLNHLR